MSDIYTLGSRNCTLPQCFEPGDCLGTLISGSWAMTANECLDRCKAEPECEYFNYNNDKICTLLKDCAAIDSRCIDTNNCIFGQVDCKRQHEFAMVAIGYIQYNESAVIYLNDVEIIDLETFSSCPIQQKSYPLEIDNTASLRNGDNVMICGGYNRPVSYDECYEYKNGDWSQTASLSVPRVGPVSIEYKPNEWIVMGGYSDGTYLATTELFQNSIWQNGPVMPEESEGGSGVMFNLTHMFVASGILQSETFSNRNWFVDVDTWTWTEISQRILTAHYFHISGIFYDPVLGETAIANICRYGIQVYYPSLNSWVEQTTPLFEGLYAAQTLQLSTEYFLIIGGYKYDSQNGNQENDAIYRFDHNGVTLIEENALNVGRHYHALITIPESQINCY